MIALFQRQAPNCLQRAVAALCIRPNPLQSQAELLCEELYIQIPFFLGLFRLKVPLDRNLRHLQRLLGSFEAQY